jgi:hypothetical protein
MCSLPAPPMLLLAPTARPRALPESEPWGLHRKDFWNDPHLWDDITDPWREMCWDKIER